MTKEGLFPKIIEKDVNLEKINIQFFSKWVEEKIAEILGFEDEIVIGFINNILETSKAEKKKIPGKRFQLELTGFLEKKTPAFVEELWTLLLDAQEQSSGIPSVVIERKKREILEREERTQVKQSHDQRGSNRPTAQGSDDETDDHHDIRDRKDREPGRERRRSSSPRRGERDSRGADRSRIYGRDRSVSRSCSRERRHRERHRGERRREISRDREERRGPFRDRSRSRSRERRRSRPEDDRRRYRSRSTS